MSPASASDSSGRAIRIAGLISTAPAAGGVPTAGRRLPRDRIAFKGRNSDRRVPRPALANERDTPLPIRPFGGQVFVTPLRAVRRFGASSPAPSDPSPNRKPRHPYLDLGYTN